MTNARRRHVADTDNQAVQTVDSLRRLAAIEKLGHVHSTRQLSGAGGPAGTGTKGDMYYDTTADRLWLSDGIGWVVMAEPLITTFVPAVAAGTGTLTTVTATFKYTRNDGWMRWQAGISITANGTGAQLINFTLPTIPAPANQGILGHGREILVNGHMLNVQQTGTLNVGTVIKYDNTYPGGTGTFLALGGLFLMSSRYS